MHVGAGARCFAIAVALLAWLAGAFGRAQADGSGPITPFPLTGAYQARLVEDRNHVSVIELTGNYNRNLDGGALNVEPRAVVSQEFFRTHPDNYDFIVAFSGFEFDTGQGTAFHWGVRNAVKGIGIPQFDAGTAFGSPTRLQGFIDMAALTRYVTDPLDPRFETVLSVLTHEVLHQWAAHVRVKSPDDSLSDVLLGRDGSHWSFLLDSGASVMYGNQWKDNGDGTFSSTATRKFLSPLDLYLMGFYKPEEVPPFFVVENPGIDKARLPEENVTVSGTKRIITIDDIIAAEGPRVPAAGEAQKEFRMAFVLLVGPSQRATDAQLAAINRVRDAFMTRFAILTGGRATAQVYPEALPTVEAGAPAVVGGGELRPGQASLDDGLAWLRARQNAEGYWADKDTTRVRDTVVALRTLARLDLGFTNAPAALQWLSQQEGVNADNLARTAEVLSQLGGDSSPLRQRLLGVQNADGGFGIAQGYRSDALDTALAVLALQGAADATAVVDKAKQYLYAKQNEDGSWSGAEGGAGRTSVTSTVLEALKEGATKETPAVAKALAWLANKQNADGGFGDSPSTTHDTANVLQVFMTYDALAGMQADSAVGYLLTRQTVEGSWDGSAYATGLAVAALKRFNFPNWALSAPVATPATPRDGDRVALSITVRNDANAIAPATVLRIYDGEPDNGGKPIGADIALPPLAPGSGVTVTPLWDTLDKAGTHTLVAIVDPDSEQSELSERDNVSALTLTVDSAPLTSDLAVVTTDIAIAPIQPNLLPITLGLSATIRNLGQTDVAGVRVVLWEGPIGTGKLVGETIIGVPNRSTAGANFTYELTKPGTTGFTIQIDPDNVVTEASEANNNAIATVTTAPSVDLEVTAADITLDKDPALVGADATFTVRLRNRGTMDSPAAAVNYLISDGGASTVIRTNTVEVPAGATIEQTIAWRVDRPGNLVFSVGADAGQQVPELDEGNNTASLSFTSNLPSGINLAVDYKDISFTPNPGLEGRDVIISATIRNPGTVAAQNVDVVFYAGDPAQGAPQIGTAQTLATLPAGGSATASVTWPVLASPGSKLVYVVVDPQNAIAEFTKDDNAAFEVLEVLSLPDLAISSTDILVSPSAPKTGDTLTISARVTNLGDQSAQDVLVRLFDGDPAAGGKQIGGDNVIPLVAPRATGLAEFTWAFDGAPGAHTLFVQVDPLKAINERNKTNNNARREIAVQNSDLYLSHAYFSPNNDGVKDTTLFSFRLAAPTTVSIVVIDQYERVVRRFEGPQFTDITAGEVVWDGLDNSGRLVADGAYRLRVLDSSGAVINEAPTTVDTNRSPLTEALGTKYRRLTNLSCNVPTGSLSFTDDESAVYVLNGKELPDAGIKIGLYRIAPDGSTFERLTSYETYVENWVTYPWLWDLEVAGDASVITYRRIYARGEYRHFVDSNGKDVPVTLAFEWGADTYSGMSKDGRYVFSSSTGDGTYLYDTIADHFRKVADKMLLEAFSPDSKKRFVILSGRPAIFDLESGQSSHLDFNVEQYARVDSVWSPDSSYLLLKVDQQDKRVAIYDRDGNLVRDFSSFILPTSNISWASSGTEFAVAQDGAVYVANVATGTVEKRAEISGNGIAWIPGERTVINGDQLVDLDDGSARPFLPGANFTRFSPTGRKLIFYTDSLFDEMTNCIGQSSVGTVESLLNLTAELRPVRSVNAGGMLLKGTATDRNFGSYYLEYAYATAPDAWLPVAPASGQPVIDGLLATWVPPSAGTYFVRLTVEDQAGNLRRVSKRVTWSDLPSITDIFRSPAIISPNGDGVQDSTTVHYRILEPVHLEFNFFNGDGQRVRTIVREHADIGASFDLLWDGRDDAGVVVQDGEYRMTVLDYEFFITVDTQPPVVTLALNDAYQGELDKDTGVTYVKVAPALMAAMQEPHVIESLIEAGEGQDPAAWSLYHDNSLKERGEGTPSTIGISISDAMERRFRHTGVDGGGNRSSVMSRPIKEQLIISQFGNARFNAELKDLLGPAYLTGPTPETATLLAGQEDWVQERGGYFAPVARAPYAPMESADGGGTIGIELESVRFDVAETIRASLLQLFVQFRPAEETAWQEAAITDIFSMAKAVPAYTSGPPNYAFGLTWDLKGVRSGVTYVVRLRGVDAAGGSHYSNTLRFETKGLIFHGLAKQKPSTDEYALWGEEFISETLSEARLYLSSTDDPRYTVEQVVAVVHYPGETITFSVPLTSCRSYTGYLVVKTEPRYDPVAKQLISTTISSGRKTFRAPCLELTTQVDVVPAEACDAPPQNKLTIRFAPMSLDGTPLKLLTLSRVDSVTGEDVLFNVNQPDSVPSPTGGQPKYIYEFALDTKDLPEGEYPLTARLINVQDQETAVALRPFIDHTPPAVTLGYPAEGQRLCGVPKAWADGSLHGVLEFDGAVSDAGGLHYALELATGAGSASYVEIHNSRRLDSLRVSSGGDGEIDPERPKYHLKNVTGPLAAIVDKDGEMRARLRVMDRGGFESCLVRSFYFDGNAEVAPTTISARLFSPNRDGIYDDVTIRYEAEELITVDIAIFGSEPDPEAGSFVRGPLVRRLVSGLTLSGPGESVWAGENDSGQVVPDGRYEVVITFKDGCGNPKQQMLHVEVDNTPPSVAINYPKPTDPLPLMVEVRGSVHDFHLASHRVDVGAGGAPESWSNLSMDTRNVSDEVIARWNTFGLGGAYTLRLAAEDTVGNQTELEVPLMLVERTNLISYFEPMASVLSPNGDGNREFTSLRFGVDKESRITLRIEDAAGTVVRTFLEDQLTPSGPGAILWDGKNDGGTKPVDGPYTAVLYAGLAANPSVTQEERASIFIDTSAPAINITRPSGGYARGAGSIIGSVTDPHLVEYKVSLTDSPAAPTWIVIGSGTESRSEVTLGSLDGLEEGDYAIKIEAIDQGENSIEQIVPLVIDNTPPVVLLRTPANGEAFTSKSGSVRIEGRIEELNLKAFGLSVGEGADPVAWTPLANGTAGQLPNPVAEWDVSGAPDGIYTLRLSAEDKAGSAGDSRATISVDNTAPTALLTVPGNGYIQGPIDLSGTANDANFAQYRLLIAPSSAGTAQQWSEIGSGTQPVDSGVLLSWQTMPVDGVYSLKLAVSDKVGNVSEAVTEVAVDTRPPATPQGLEARLESRFDAHISWQANTEMDLVGYLVYRNGQLLNAAPLSARGYIDADLTEGRYVYTVRAIDQAGLQSEAANSAALIIDLTPPQAKIQMPENGNTVSGIVDITGIIYGGSDFKEYRLYVGEGVDPISWQLLHVSPVPLQNATLGTWNTLSATEGAAYVIKLETEDITGNVGAVTATVTVDNLPPGVPVGLSATSSGAGVQLTWMGNTESDVIGYLLYRDVRLVNATADVLGDMRTYAIKSTAYSDTSLPDGRYVYSLAAIDSAGNVSALSSPLSVTLDDRAPHAVILEPAPGSKFEGSVLVAATTPDRDVQQVQFQFRKADAAVWQDFGPPDTTAPYEALWNANGLPYGDYQLRAVAMDIFQKVDPSPSQIAVVHTDLTPPAVSGGLQAGVQGADVTLSWDANTESDIFGYHVYRESLAQGDKVRVTTEPTTGTVCVDGGVNEGRYRYTIAAVDSYGNEAMPSDGVEAAVYTPDLIQPPTPTTDIVMRVQGAGIGPAQVIGELTRPSGVIALPPLMADAQGQFTLPELALEQGANTLSVRLVDAAGNISKEATVKVRVVGSVPSAPTGLAAKVSGTTVSLAWSRSPEPNILGYRLFRDGEHLRLFGDRALLGQYSASSSLSGFGPSLVSDGNNQTYWSPDTHGGSATGQWIKLDFTTLRLVTGINISWADEAGIAVDYNVEAWDVDTWVPLVQIRGNADLNNTLAFPQPYPTTQIRLKVLKASTTDGMENNPKLAEMGGRYRFYTTAITVGDYGVTTGWHDYSASAIDANGFESPRSVEVKVAVGDLVPPDPVILTASVGGSDVTLTWSTSSADAYRYEVYRDGLVVGTVYYWSPRTFIDAARPNGTYRYTVNAVDLASNASASNEELVTVFMAPPEAPRNLIATPLPTGGAIDLSWDSAEQGVPAGYRLLRATDMGGPYEVVVSTAADTAYRDTGLSNGVVYYYVVAGLDAIGNISPLSNEVSALCSDVVATAPRIFHPVTPGQPWITEEKTATVIGMAEPGASLVLDNNGSDSVQGRAIVSADVTAADSIWFEYTPVMSRNANSFVFVNNSNVLVHDLDTGQTVSMGGSYSGYDARPSWSSDDKEIIYTSGNYVFAVKVAYGARRVLATSGYYESLYIARMSPDGKSLAVIGKNNSRQGLWHVDLATQAWTLLVDTATAGLTHDFLVWSPDSRQVVFRRNGWPAASLELVDVVSGSIRVIDPLAAASAPHWSADGSSLLFTSHRDGSDQIYRYEVADQTSHVITRGPSRHWTPQWSPDGNSIAYHVGDYKPGPYGMVEVRSVAIHNLQDGTVMPVEASLALNGIFLQWLENGYLGYSVGDHVRRVSPPGRFEIKGVPLQVGDNVVTAVARDAAGNVSQPSQAVVITRTQGDQPDLTSSTQDLVLLPAMPLAKRTAVVSLTVRNAGTLAASSAPVSLLALDANGQGVSLLETQTSILAPGQTQTFSVDWTPESAGAYTLVAMVDAYNVVTEASDANNLALREVVVASEAAPSVTVTLDHAEVGPNESLNGRAILTNSGDALNATFVLAVEDNDGYLVETIEAKPVSLAYGERLEEVLSWNAGTTFAGTYRVHAKLIDDRGMMVAEGTAAFTLRAGSVITSSLTTDRASYGANTDVVIQGGISYTSGNDILSGATLSLRVEDAAGGVLAEKSEALGALLPGASSASTLIFNTGLLPVGTYTAKLVARTGQNVVSEAQASFTIEPSGAIVKGALALSEASPAPGTTQVARYTVRNLGNTPASAYLIRILLLDADGQVLATQTRSYDLGVGAEAADSAAFDTTDHALGAYTVRLEGEAGPETYVSLATGSFTLVDRTAPELALTTPTAGGFLGSTKALVLARDTLSGVAAVDLRVDGGAWLPAPVHDAAAALYGAILMQPEGSHTIEARAVDAYGNTAVTGPVSFTVDTTSPTISIDGVANDGLYNHDVVPAIAITDAYLKSRAVTINGAAYAAGTPVTEEGDYQLAVSAEDDAGNRSDRALWFAIDKTPPVITIVGVEDGGLYGQSVTPLVTISDMHLRDEAITLNSEPFASGTPIDADGTYTLVATAEDGATNASAASLTFTVDKTPPGAPVVTHPAEGGVVNDRLVAVTGQSEPGATVFLSVAGANSQALCDELGNFSFPAQPFLDGEHTIRLFAHDRAGNVGPATDVRFSVVTAELAGVVRAPTGVLVLLPNEDRNDRLRSRLESVLIERGTDYLFTHDEAAFVAALRTHRYATVLLAERHAGDCDEGLDGSCLARAHQLKLGAAALGELRANIAGGIGLIWVKPDSDSNEHFADVLGARLHGLLPGVTGLTLPDSPASGAGSYTLSGVGVRARPTTGRAVGQLDSSGDPALVLHTYGLGPVALVAFDPAGLDDGAVKAVLSPLLGFAARPDSALLPGGLAEISVRATRLRPPVTVRLDEHLDPALTAVRAFGGEITGPHAASWTRTLDVDEAVFISLVRLPELPGSYGITARLAEQRADVLLPLVEKDLVVTLTGDRGTLGAAAMEAIAGTSGTRVQDLHRRDRALSLVHEALLSPLANRADALSVIGKLLDAVDLLQSAENLSGQIDAIQAIGALLGAVEVAWVNLD